MIPELQSAPVTAWVSDSFWSLSDKVTLWFRRFGKTRSDLLHSPRQGMSIRKAYAMASWLCARPIPHSPTHQAVSGLSQWDELLVAGGAHVEADGQHLLEGSHDQGGLHRVELPPSLLVLPLLVLTSRLRGLRSELDIQYSSTPHSLTRDTQCWEANWLAFAALCFSGRFNFRS